MTEQSIPFYQKITQAIFKAKSIEPTDLNVEDQHILRRRIEDYCLGIDRALRDRDDVRIDREQHWLYENITQLADEIVKRKAAQS